MSSIAQYKEALKREKKIIADLKKENFRLKEVNQQLIMAVKHYKAILYLRQEEKKWWQFWK